MTRDVERARGRRENAHGHSVTHRLGLEGRDGRVCIPTNPSEGVIRLRMQSPIFIDFMGFVVP